MRPISDLTNDQTIAWNSGLSCPCCRSQDGFIVHAKALVRISSVNGWSRPEELSLHHSDSVTCKKCLHQGPARDFNHQIRSTAPAVQEGHLIELDVISHGGTPARQLTVSTISTTTQLLASALDSIEASPEVESVCLDSSGMFDLDWQTVSGKTACTPKSCWAIVSEDGIRFSAFNAETQSILLSDFLTFGELLVLDDYELSQADSVG